jgi:hypothetical protein
MNGKGGLLGLALSLCASAAVAAKPACGLKIERAWVRAAPPGAAMLAGYATVKNDCAKPIAIVGVESLDFAEAMIHRTVIENGVSRMLHAARLEVPAKGKLQFAPGGMHLMLMRPNRSLPPGSTARIRLVLADGRRAFTEYEVRREAPAR